MFSYSTNSLDLLTHNTNKKKCNCINYTFLFTVFLFFNEYFPNIFLGGKLCYLQYYNKHFSILVHI